MSGQPYMPFFFGDFLASTVTWSGEERALYAMLLLCQWSTGPLPDDPLRICRMVQYERETFFDLWTTVGQKFVPAEGGGLINLRCERVRAKAAELSRKRAEAGARGARVTNAKHAACTPSPSEDEQPADIAPANAAANAEALPRHPIQSNPIQSIPTQQQGITHRTSATCDDCDSTCCDHDDALREAQQTIDAEFPEALGFRPPEKSDIEFEAIQRAYPKRAGSQRWQDARNAFNARTREGHSFAEMLDGVNRYAAHVRAKGDEGTSYVQQAATFLGRNRGFLEPWSSEPTRAEQRQTRAVNAAQAWLNDSEGTR